MLPLQNAVQAAESTYTPAALGFLSLGARDAVDIYRLAPNLLPRTVRYIAVELVKLLHMVTSLDATYQDVSKNDAHSQKEENAQSFLSLNECVYAEVTTPPTPSVEDLEELATLAKKAGVPRVTAQLSVSKFRNPVSVVRQTLTDIADMIQAGCENVKPTALFVWAMRRGESLKLPTRILEQREATLERAEDKKRITAVSTVGEIILWFGRTPAVVLEVSNRLNTVLIEVLKDSGDGFEGSRFSVPINQLRPMS